MMCWIAALMFRLVLVCYRFGMYTGGRVHLYYGSTVLSTTADLVLTASENFTFFGAALSGAGDVNGDGYNDLLVSEQNYQSGTGRQLIFPGSSAGLVITPIWTVKGDGTDDVSGTQVAPAGDVNGDGYDDVMVMSIRYDDENRGDVSVQLFNGAPMAMSTTPSWYSRDKSLHVGRLSMASAGDVNGDGYDDVLLGGRTYADTLDMAWLYLGSPQGLQDIASKIITDGQDSSLFGLAVACAGDVNNDGYDDILIGAPGYDNDQKDEGRVVAYYGAATTTDVVDDRSSAPLYAAVVGNILTGEAPLSMNVQLLRGRALQVEVFTVPGARLLQRTVEIGAGMQRVDITLPRVLPSGLYFARLSAESGEVITLPFSVVQ